MSSRCFSPCSNLSARLNLCKQTYLLHSIRSIRFVKHRFGSTASQGGISRLRPPSPAYLQRCPLVFCFNASLLLRQKVKAEHTRFWPESVKNLQTRRSKLRENVLPNDVFFFLGFIFLNHV